MTTTKMHSYHIGHEMLNEAIKFWFNDHEHIRSPFPTVIRDELREKSFEIFFTWVAKLADKAKKEINDEIVAEKFEEILFETATKLVKTNDEKLTILYPFLPRIGDQINENKTPEDTQASIIIDRLHIKRGDNAFLKVICKTEKSGEEWSTEFELPE